MSRGQLAERTAMKHRKNGGALFKHPFSIAWCGRIMRALGLVIVPVEALQGVPMPRGQDGKPWELPAYAPLPAPDPSRCGSPEKREAKATLARLRAMYTIPQTQAAREKRRRDNLEWMRRRGFLPDDDEAP